MIKSIRFENFFCFKNTKIELEKGTNCLIGINGSGKTNFLKAIKLLYEGVAGIGLKNLIIDNWGGFENIYFSDLENDIKDRKYIEIEYELDKNIFNHFDYDFGEDFFYIIRIHKDPGQSNYYVYEKIHFQNESGYEFIYLEFGNGKGGILSKPDESEPLIYKFLQNPSLVKYNDIDPQELASNQISDPERFSFLDSIKKTIKESIVYFYIDTTPLSKIRNAILPTSEKRLVADGRNLAQILNTIRMNFRSNYKNILGKLNDVNQNYSDVNFNLVGTNIELVLEEKKLNKVIHVSNISDGTLHFLCLLSIFNNPNRGQLVCIDEPETGLHPDMMLQITNAIQEFSDETQFIIATHSENILNAFNLENIRV
ncbi:MAG: AAA family ATPase, partial [Candidatus Cloacimonetes bacterium]|nr:AAA family ATPase [Candidatus Cloacimonadota bacterium]